MSTTIMTVGIGDNGTIVKGIIIDGTIVCSVAMSKKQVQDHIAVLQRHVDLIPDDAIWLPAHQTIQ